MSSRRPEEATIADAHEVLERLMEGCQVIDHDFRYVYVNAAAASDGRVPREELLGRTMMEVHPGIDKTPMFGALRRAMAERVEQRMENERVCPDGSSAWFELRFVPIREGVCVLSVDVTEKKRMSKALARSEAQRLRAQRIEAVGRLAAGVAHDFNNVLAAVLSYSELILGEVEPGSVLASDVLEIRRASERGADLTRQLLAFSRQQVLEPRPVQLGECVAGMSKMIERLAGAGVEVTVLPPRDRCMVKVDPAQLEHSVMNLVLSACDAMPHGGKLTVQVGEVELDAESAGLSEGIDLKPGRWAMLAVTDTGVGMDKDTQAHLFEPFFTTKERGEGTGTGLSLASVFGFVTQSGGHLSVYSEVGRGTTVKVFLPSADGGDEAREEPPTPPIAGAQGNETVLLVEDDDQVRTAVSGILRRLGYVVLDVPTAGEALLASEQCETPIDLLLTDVVLPRMSGTRLAERLLSTRPDMRVLYMSGYTDETVVLHGLLASGAAFLQKPFKPQTLATKVREALSVPQLS